MSSNQELVQNGGSSYQSTPNHQSASKSSGSACTTPVKIIIAVVIFAVCLAIILACSLTLPKKKHRESVYVDGKAVNLENNDDEPSLYKYLEIPDKTFSWNADDEPFRDDSTAKVRFYRMTLNSLQWLTEEEVSPSKWSHEVIVAVPYTPLEGKATLWITGCNVSDGIEASCYQGDIGIASTIASSTGIITVVLFNIPIQPTVFASDPEKMVRVEDTIASYTWNTFMVESPNRPDWIGYFPMVKAALRCMDAAEAFTKTLVAAGTLTKPADQWYIFGMSKRGATTWLLTAYLGAKYPNRIFGSSPVIFDALNFKEVVVESMTAKLGAFTHALRPYAPSIPHFLDDAKLDSLLRHIDVLTPWYSKGLSAVHKNVISAGMDEFFLLGNDRYWYHKLENKQRLIVPQANHSFMAGRDWLFQGIAFHASALARGQKPPVVVETVDHAAQTITMCSDVKPTTSTLYSGSPNPQQVPRIDYRQLRFPIAENCLAPATLTESACVSPTNWATTTIEPTLEDGMWCAHHHQTDVPTDTWVSSLIVFVWDATSAKGPALLSTPVLVLPDRTPFVGCITDKKNCEDLVFI